MTIKSYSSNWTVFNNGEAINIDTTCYNAEVYENLDEVAADIIEQVEVVGALSDSEKAEISSLCNVEFSSRF